jgi:hypothetical protein
LIVAELKNPAAVEPLEADSMETKLHPDGWWPGGLLSYFFAIRPVPGRDIDLIGQPERLRPHY